jgi:predicted nucleic acid-binding protein
VAVVTPVFLDTTVLLGGQIDFGPSSADAQIILDAIADKFIAHPMTAWHCCLEFFAVATRLPPAFRLSPEQAFRLLEDIMSRVAVKQLPGKEHLVFLETAVRDRVAGGRIYDAHIAEIAQTNGARIVVTDNRRHFASLMMHGIHVMTAGEFVRQHLDHYN